MKTKALEPFTIAEISKAQKDHICAVNYAVAFEALNRLIQFSPTEKEREKWRDKLQQIA